MTLIDVLMVPFVLWNEVLDILMQFIPRRVWDWLWRDARLTGSNELAGETDAAIRIVLSAGILLVVVWIGVWIGACLNG